MPALPVHTHVQTRVHTRVPAAALVAARPEPAQSKQQDKWKKLRATTSGASGGLSMYRSPLADHMAVDGFH